MSSRKSIQNAPMPSTLKRDKRIRVLLVEDHGIVREGLRLLLEAESDIHVIAEAENGRQAVRLAEKFKPEVILMDIAMPLLNGLEATRQIRVLLPFAKILILSAHSDDAYVEQMMAIGASGYIIKQTSFLILANAIRQVYQGKLYFSPTIEAHFQNRSSNSHGVPGKLPANLQTLSSREMEVLQLVAEGKANKQIAGELTISIKTVEKHRQKLMEKLNIHDTAGLTRYSIAAGIIESSIQLTIL